MASSTMKRPLLTVLFLALGLIQYLNAQNQSRITGNLQSNGNFFIKDEKIGASGTPQYDFQKFGAESWLNLNYSNWGFDVGLRFDLFNNSNLLNPLESFTGEGVGRWYVRKTIDKFELSGGYLYDQIGSGIIFRAYEERALMIDNALFGVKAGYNINDNWRLKAFTGRVKQQFGTYGAVVRGGSLEGFIKADSSSKVSFAPGIGMVARTSDDETIDQVVNAIATFAPADSIGAQYNTYAATIFNTMVAGPFSWYVEGAFKTKDVMNDPFQVRADGGRGILVNRPGYTVYSSLAYANDKGLGITLEYKRTKDFSFRATPFRIGIQGPLNFLPPMARQNTYRLTARFAPATQELGEQAIQLDLRYRLNKKLSLGLNFSDIQLLDGTELYREIAPEFTYKGSRKWQVLGGIQLMHYNMPVYQGKTEDEDPNDPIKFLGGGEVDYVDALTPYAEFLYKFTPKRSLRVEAQYLLTDDEFGSWVNALAEVGLAPNWLIYVSDMYKLPQSDKDTDVDDNKTKYDRLHYPTVGIVYTFKANRFSLAYVKQVEGINCAGGICRFEPTFHGVQLRLNSAF